MEKLRSFLSTERLIAGILALRNVALLLFVFATLHVDENLGFIFKAADGNYRVTAASNERTLVDKVDENCAIFDVSTMHQSLMLFHSSKLMLAVLSLALALASVGSVLFDRFTPERLTRIFVLVSSEGVASFLIVILRLIYSPPGNQDCFIDRYHSTLFLGFAHQAVQVLISCVLFVSIIALGGAFVHQSRLGLYFRNMVGQTSCLWNNCLGFAKMLNLFIAVISIGFPIYQFLIGSVVARGLIYVNFDMTAFTFIFLVADIFLVCSSVLNRFLKKRPKLAEEKTYEEMELSERPRSDVSE